MYIPFAIKCSWEPIGTIENIVSIWNDRNIINITVVHERHSKIMALIQSNEKLVSRTHKMHSNCNLMEMNTKQRIIAFQCDRVEWMKTSWANAQANENENYVKIIVFEFFFFMIIIVGRSYFFFQLLFFSVCCSLFGLRSINRSCCMNLTILKCNVLLFVGWVLKCDFMEMPRVNKMQD